MGKLATTGRLVTRDKEEQQKSSVWSRGCSDASSGCALPAVFPRAVARGVEESRRAAAGPGCLESVPRARNVPGAGGDEDSSRDRKPRVVVAAVDRPGGLGRCVDGVEDRLRISERGRESPRCEEPVAETARGTYVEARESRRRWRRRRWAAGSKELSLLFGVATIVAALCAPAASAGPTLSREAPLSRTGPRRDLDRSGGLEDVYEDAFEDAFPEEIGPTTTRTVLDETELNIIRRSIARGLGLERIPDPSKANVSQAEYVRAHNEYLSKLQLSSDRRSLGSEKKLYVFPAAAYPGNQSSRFNEDEGRHRRRLFFPVELPDEGRDASSTVDHATLRLLLHGPMTDDYTQRSELEALLYLKTVRGSRKLIHRRRVRLADARNSRWLEFDATVAASSWLDATVDNVGLELEFRSDGEPVRRSFSSAFLNVFTARPFDASTRAKRSSPEELMPLHKGRRTKCKGESKKCCRHELTVMFKELKGFEFIVYPKTFDAGYCKGRCPPRYNPAHHHALLQSLLWKEDRKKVPKPCCAPSKLDQLMIVYFDENDSTQLKVSYWKNIQVLECACS